MAFSPLPSYSVGNALNFEPLNTAVNNWGETRRQNALMGYKQEQDALANQRQNALLNIQQAQESRAQKQFNEQEQQQALQHLAGIHQVIQSAPEADRPALYQRFQPMYDKVRQRFPDFDADLNGAGHNPSDFATIGPLISGWVGGYKDPLETQKAQADIDLKNAQAGYYRERPRTAAGGATTDLVNRLMADNPNLSLEEAITIAKRGSGVTQVGDELVNRNTGASVRNVAPSITGQEVAKGEGQNIAKARADMPEASQRLSMITGGLDRLEKSAQSLATMKGLDSVVGGLYQAYAPNVFQDALNAQTELENLKVKVSGVVLQAMRDASKTGGAVGQVTEREWPRLENMIANLDPRQGKEQFMRNLQEIIAYTQGTKAALQQAYESQASMAGGSATPKPPAGGFKYLGPAD